MIISEFHFFQVKREPFFGDAMEFNNSFFSVTPEPFNAVDVNFPIAKMFPMVNIDMPVPTEHQRIVAPEFVSINDAAPSDHFDCQIQKSFGFNIFNYLYMDTAVSLEDTEYGNLIGGTASTFAFAFAPKIRLVDFNGSVHPIRGNRVLPDRPSDKLDSLESRGITQPDLLSNPARGNFQFKELDDPQPFFRADPDFIQPSAAEVMEGILAPLTPVPFLKQSIDFITVTPAAKNMPFFPAEFSQVQSGTVFTFDDELKGF